MTKVGEMVTFTPHRQKPHSYLSLKQTGLDSEEHENRQLTNGDISDMDIFADVKTSSCDSSRPPTSNSVEASSEIFDKGNTKTVDS